MSVFINDTTRDLSVRPSQIPNAGSGVYTNEDIKMYSIIGVYTGRIVVPSSKIKNRDYIFHVSKRILVDALQTPRCIMAMVNSNNGSQFSQNCKFVIQKRGKNPVIVVEAICDISRGSELFISYGDSYFV